MLKDNLAHFIMLPELKLCKNQKISNRKMKLFCEKKETLEYCPKCATPSQSIYDHRVIKCKDEPLRNALIELVIKKRRLWCKVCQKPFTEPVEGIGKHKRFTERYERGLFWACENYVDLQRVRKRFKCSGGFLYKTYYKFLELERRKRLYSWPEKIAVDEHFFRRHPKYHHAEFASVIVDQTNKRLIEVVHGKQSGILEQDLAYIPGRENVRYAAMDLCDPYRNFIRNFFPNAEIVADKFHVLRLLSPHLLRKRKEITGDRATLRAKKLLLMSSHSLDYWSRKALYTFLEKYPYMNELYCFKEDLHRFYRIRGYDRAIKAFTEMTDKMALSELPEIKTLRKTLLKWRVEILNYFKTGLTNARTEGFNRIASLVKNRAFGYKSFRNYRLRLLDACS